MVCPISPVSDPQPDKTAAAFATPDQLFQILSDLSCPVQVHHHPPIFTVAEGADLEKSIPGAHCRNLFLKDKKDRMVLVTALNETAVDLKILAERLGMGRLSFGSPDRLMRHLGVAPGSVCPFAVMNDPQGAVPIVLDSAMKAHTRVNVHPLINTMTIGIAPQDLVRFLTHVGHPPQFVDF